MNVHLTQIVNPSLVSAETSLIWSISEQDYEYLMVGPLLENGLMTNGTWPMVDHFLL